MIPTSQLAEEFARNLWVVRAQTEGITHENSLCQPPFRGKCLNWVLGHLAQYQDQVLAVLGAEPVMGRAALVPVFPRDMSCRADRASAAVGRQRRQGDLIGRG